MKRVVLAVTLALACVCSAAAAAQPPQRQEIYVPVDSLPQQEQMAAAPLLIGAYSVVLLAFFGYMISVARRLQVVQREIERVEIDLRKTGRG